MQREEQGSPAQREGRGTCSAHCVTRDPEPAVSLVVLLVAKEDAVLPLVILDLPVIIRQSGCWRKPHRHRPFKFSQAPGHMCTQHTHLVFAD